MPSAPPSLVNSAQCGQVIEAYSTSFTGALGLPIRKPRSVSLTVVVQSPPLGAATFATGPFVGARLAVPLLPPPPPQAARVKARAAAPAREKLFISSSLQF